MDEEKPKIESPLFESSAWDVDEDPIDGGGYGEVYRARHKATGDLRAIKKIPYQVNCYDEVEIFEKMDHDNIVKMFGHFREITNNISYCLIVMEFMEKGSLEKRIKESTLNEKEAVKITRKVLIGLEYLHNKSIIHRDMKPANILLDNHDNIKLCDFGISKAFHDHSKTYKFTGTLNYMSYEILFEKPYGRKCDVWSVGCTIIEMLTGVRPWAKLTYPQVLFKMGENMSPEIPNNISIYLQTFFALIFTVEKDRLSTADALEHDWLKSDSGKVKSEKMRIQEFLSCKDKPAALAFYDQAMKVCQTAETSEFVQSTLICIRCLQDILKVFENVEDKEKAAIHEIKEMVGDRRDSMKPNQAKELAEIDFEIGVCYKLAKMFARAEAMFQLAQSNLEHGFGKEASKFNLYSKCFFYHASVLSKSTKSNVMVEKMQNAIDHLKHAEDVTEEEKAQKLEQYGENLLKAKVQVIQREDWSAEKLCDNYFKFADKNKKKTRMCTLGMKDVVVTEAVMHGYTAKCISKHKVIPQMEKMLENLSVFQNDNERVEETAFCWYYIGRCYSIIEDFEGKATANKNGIKILEETFKDRAHNYTIYCDLLTGLGDAYENLYKFDMAEETYSKSISSHAHVKNWPDEKSKPRTFHLCKSNVTHIKSLKQGYQHIGKKKWTEAMDKLEEGFETSSEGVHWSILEMRKDIGRIYYLIKQMVKSGDEVAKAIASGNFLIRMKKIADLVTSSKVRYHPVLYALQHNKAWCFVGKCERMLGKHIQSAHSFQKCLEIMKSNISESPEKFEEYALCHFYLGRSLIENQNLGDACVNLKTALRLFKTLCAEYPSDHTHKYIRKIKVLMEENKFV